MNINFKIIENIKCYAPELAINNNDYPAEEFKMLFELEDKNFWFNSRNRVIKNLFNKYIGNVESDILEIGCGTGYVLKGLQENFDNYNLYGSEIHLEGIKYAKKRLPSVEFIQLDATKMPFKDEFDAIGAFDVIEHIDEDEMVISQIYKSLKNNGFLFLSVPQYKWMWSINDDFAFHKRRYSKKELHTKVEKAGFNVKFISSFVFVLFPMMVLSRFLQSNKQDNNTKEMIIKKELDVNPILNSIFTFFMKIDEVLIKLNISLPFGGSIILVAQKKSN